MTKNRRHLDEMSVNLPEVVVMPRGSYINWKGDEDIVPSKEQFIDDTINKRRVEAIHSMLNRKAPAIPNNPSRNPLSILAGKLGASDDTRRFVFGVDKNGQTCIYTVSSNYNDKPISGNKTFANNPESYGFKEVNNNNAILGDIVQFYGYNDILNNAILGDQPHHMTMITGFNKKGQPALSYSNGGRNAENLRKDNDNWGEGGDRDLATIGKYTKTYRYVGSPELRKKTSSHYDYIYGKRSNMSPIESSYNLFKSRKTNRRTLEYGGRFKYADGGTHRRIKKGDTLSKIAKEYTGNPMRYNELAQLNNISNPDRIEIGQDIIIPSSFTDSIKNNELPEVVVIGHRKEKKQRPRIHLDEATFNKPEQTNSLYVSSIPNRTQSIEELNAPNFIESKIQDAKDVIRESGNIGDFIQTAWNGVAKHFVDDKEVKTQKRQLKITKETPKEVLDEAFAKETRNGTDTLIWDRVPVDRTGNKYYIQESYPITDNMRFGSRNRLEYRDLDSNNAPLTTYRPIRKYEDYVKGITYDGKNYKAVDRDSEGHQNHFMGYDKDGKFKIGPLSKFGPGDTMTQVYYFDIIGVPRDANGNIQYVEDSNNPGRFQPVVDVYNESTYDENGKLQRGSRGKGVLTTMTEKRSFEGRYGNVSGGRVLLQAGNETRVVAGSIEHVIQELELMQKNHKGQPVRYYQLDNGSYNRGLRTRNGKNISARDLKDYDKQNTTSAGGGHFMYIRNKYSNGGSIHIAPSKRGTFTAAATKHGMGVQEFASKVLRNKENYSPSLVKKANFARNASKWNH